MKDKLDDSWLKNWQLESQLKNKIEEYKKELVKINEQINSSKYSPLSNYTPGKIYSLEDIELRRLKLQYEREIRELEKSIDEKNKHQEDSKETSNSFQSRKIIWDDIPIENKPSNLPSNSNLGYSQSPRVDPIGSKPSSQDKPRGTILFWLIALLLVIYFLFQQGTNEKQQPKQQNYPQDVSALSSESNKRL